MDVQKEQAQLEERENHLFGLFWNIQGKDMKGDLMRPTNI